VFIQLNKTHKGIALRPFAKKTRTAVFKGRPLKKQPFLILPKDELLRTEQDTKEQ